MLQNSRVCQLPTPPSAGPSLQIGSQIAPLQIAATFSRRAFSARFSFPQSVSLAPMVSSSGKSGSSEMLRSHYLLVAACLLLARVVSLKLGLVIAAMAAAAKLASAWLADRGSRPKGSPPLIPGLPLIGSGHEFRRNAVPFLLECRRKFGDMFTVRFPLGQRIHFLMNPHYVQQFASTRSFDFLPIQQVVNTNVFRFRAPNQEKMLRHMCKHARLAVDTDSFAFSSHANRSFELVAESTAGCLQGTVALNDLVTDTMFRSVFNTVYGDCDAKPFNYRAVKELFKPIHKSFNFLWLGVPSFLFPSTQAAWRDIYKAFPGVHSLMLDGTCNAYIRDCIGKWLEGGWIEETVAGHNMVYLHVYHNNCKIAFWLINNLLHYPEQTAKLVEEVEAALVSEDAGDGSAAGYQISVEALESLPILDSCIQETYRLASGLFLMREVTQDTEFPMEDGQRMRLGKGDLISMYPPSFHRDPAIYEDPESFRLDRFAGDWRPAYEGREVRRPVLPYGVLCPGKRLSMLQLKLYTACLLVNFNLTRCPESPSPAEYDFASYGDEILPPVSADAKLSIKLRNGAGRYLPVILCRH